MELLLSFWNVLAMMAPWLLAGFFLAGVVSVLLPRAWVVSAMGRAKGWRADETIESLAEAIESFSKMA